MDNTHLGHNQWAYKYVIRNDIPNMIEHEDYRARTIIGEYLFDLAKQHKGGVAVFMSKERRPTYSTHKDFMFNPMEDVIEYRVGTTLVQHETVRFAHIEPNYHPVSIARGEIKATKAIDMIKELYNRTPFSKRYNDDLIKRARKEL